MEQKIYFILDNMKPENTYFFESDLNYFGKGIAEKDLFICFINLRKNEKEQIKTVIHEAGHGVPSYNTFFCNPQEVSRIESELDNISEQIYKTNPQLNKFIKDVLKKSRHNFINHHEIQTYAIKLLNEYMGA
ncbi:MAG: hypothetical protein ABH811_02435 [archaeon]